MALPCQCQRRIGSKFAARRGTADPGRHLCLAATDMDNDAVTCGGASPGLGMRWVGKPGGVSLSLADELPVLRPAWRPQRQDAGDSSVSEGHGLVKAFSGGKSSRHCFRKPSVPEALHSPDAASLTRCLTEDRENRLRRQFQSIVVHRPHPAASRFLWSLPAWRDYNKPRSSKPDSSSPR